MQKAHSILNLQKPFSNTDLQLFPFRVQVFENDIGFQKYTKQLGGGKIEIKALSLFTGDNFLKNKLLSKKLRYVC